MNKIQQVINTYKREKTFVLIKPDGVMRGLIGTIISKFERRGLKVIAMKMIQATEEQVRAHYPMQDDAWIARLGEKSLSSFDGLDLNPEEVLGTLDKSVIGRSVAESLVGYLTSGPSVAMIIEGLQAVTMIRKIVGHTLPSKADVGSIRADYSVDTPLIANLEARSIHNLVHASELPEEVDQEIQVRFGGKPEVFAYDRTEDKVAYGNYYTDGCGS
ncbi:MAG: nucleoside-diphosphate kinase [bacterium]|nr:nucleoside-diphosphate kinase [bacterium]